MNFAGAFILTFCCAPLAMGQVLSSQYREQNSQNTSSLSVEQLQNNGFQAAQRIEPVSLAPGFQPVQVLRPPGFVAAPRTRQVRNKKTILTETVQAPELSNLPDPVLLPNNSEIVVSSLPKLFNKK